MTEITAATATRHARRYSGDETIDGDETLKGNADEKGDLQVLDTEVFDLEDKLQLMTIDRTHRIIIQAWEMHKNDQNFPGHTLHLMKRFLNDPEVLANPDKHHELIREMKMEALLSTENSPYQEVRANVDPTDDPTMPSLTFRVLAIGTVFCAAGSFVDTFFLVRLPAISITPNVAQMVASWVMPVGRFHLFGKTYSFNPGPFSQKEHMLITIMASVSFTYPYTAFLIPTQALPMFFGQEYARNYGYQFLSTMGINFVGYGLAGLARRFLVYPSTALWPTSLLTVALNKAFHTEANEAVNGPFGWVYRRSREQVFLLAFGAMFIWYFFPGFIFTGLSIFNWISWIAPNNVNLNAICGFVNGLGVNPWPTFDWNNLTPWIKPLCVPTFSVLSQFIGIIIGTLMTIGLWYSNAWNTAYLPINDNHTFDNQGKHYNVSRVLNSEGALDADKYQAYSQAWVSAGYLTQMFWYFALYTSTLSYVALYHRYEIWLGFRSVWRTMKRMFKSDIHDEDDLAEDIHYRLMQRYPEVPDWQYFVVLLVAMTAGMVSVGVWPTHTSPSVVIYGIIMPLIAIIPCGIVQAVTGVAVPLQVLAQFIGGSFSGGNGIALMYFKSYGYISMYQAVTFCNDLKLAHYLKIPPKHTFAMQLWATLVATFVSSALLNFQMSFPNICTPQAAFRFVCPGQNTFFTGAVFWGTLGPQHLFGEGKRYNLLLLGFPVGLAVTFIHYGLKRAFPRSEWIRQIHPSMIASGPAQWGSPYNLSYYWPNVMVVLVSFQYVRKRHLAFWSKYNYVIAAAFPAGIAVCAVIIFFCLAIPNGGLKINWWGNSVSYRGCEGTACVRLSIPSDGYFGPAPGSRYS